MIEGRWYMEDITRWREKYGFYVNEPPCEFRLIIRFNTKIRFCSHLYNLKCVYFIRYMWTVCIKCDLQLGDLLLKLRNHRNNRHRMRAPISHQSKNCRHKMADLYRQNVLSNWTPVTWQSAHSISNNSMFVTQAQKLGIEKPSLCHLRLAAVA